MIKFLREYFWDFVDIIALLMFLLFVFITSAAIHPKPGISCCGSEACAKYGHHPSH